MTAKRLLVLVSIVTAVLLLVAAVGAAMAVST